MPNVYSLLSPILQEAIRESGMREPTPPQVVAVPKVLEGKNILLIAPTGTGKTEAVLLPIFDQLLKETNRRAFP